MDQTANYQLSQWETTDRILMSDFNSDNSKIDAALKGLADKVGLVTLMDQYLSGLTEQTVDLSVADMDWSKWKVLYLYAWGLTSGSSSYRFCYRAGGSPLALGTVPSGLSARVVLYPLYSGNTELHGQMFQSGDSSLFWNSISLQTITAFSFTAVQSGSTMRSCRLQIFGEP